MLLEQQDIESKDAERATARKALTRQMKDMGPEYHARGKLCVYLDDDYFLVGMDELNLTLWEDRKKIGKNPRMLGYFSRLSHLLAAYLEKRVNNASSTDLTELIDVVTRVEGRIKALDGAMIVPAPGGTDDA